MLIEGEGRLACVVDTVARFYFAAQTPASTGYNPAGMASSLPRFLWVPLT